jgi:hypothetical protein
VCSLEFSSFYNNRAPGNTLSCSDVTRIVIYHILLIPCSHMWYLSGHPDILMPSGLFVGLTSCSTWASASWPRCPRYPPRTTSSYPQARVRTRDVTIWIRVRTGWSSRTLIACE